MLGQPSGEQQLGPMPIQHGRGAVAVAVGQLGLVPDSQRLDVLGTAGGGQLGQLLNGGPICPKDRVLFSINTAAGPG